MTLIKPNKLPEHVAIIMDGNGRWAKKAGMKRVFGHQRGAEVVKEIVKASNKIGIKWLTLYSFSEENWKRPKLEIQALMSILKRFLTNELHNMQKYNIRLQCIGRNEKLPKLTKKTLQETINKTASNNGMVLTLALSYSGRQEILDTIKKIAVRIENQSLIAADLSEQLVSDFLYSTEMPDPDLLIRTSGEYRISNFLLWQIAYTELYFTSTLWPDFTKDEYLIAIKDFQKRVRRFGGS